MSVLEKLTEGIVSRSLQKEGAALMEKWERTGLLEGMESDFQKNNMARLLENQAAQLLKEASSMAAGDVEGFASVAFPLVRRVFGGLLANDLVSVQPMSLPSGLIFFLDFQHTHPKLGASAGQSLYGGGVVGQQLTGGVDLSTTGSNFQASFYNLNNGYSSPTGTLDLLTNSDTTVKDNFVVRASGTAGETGGGTAGYTDLGKMTLWDPDISGSLVSIVTLRKSDFTAADPRFNEENYAALNFVSGTTNAEDLGIIQVKRLTRTDPNDSTRLLFVFAADENSGWLNAGAGANGLSSLADRLSHVEMPLRDNFGGTPVAKTEHNTGIVAPTATWGLENTNDIPEIDIKVDSVAVTAVSKKLKAKWTPELGQDLNAYHNLDAEVELTSILSEQIALEIDREILEDLTKGATAGTYYWSRSPGLFVRRDTGAEIGASSAAPDFTGTVSEWYETLVETINDVSAQIHRKTLRGGANFVVTSPEVANILEFTAGFRASVTADADRGTIGAVNVGSLSKKWDVYVDPYFPRNLVLVGRKGGSFLESGYVYAPYVPLQVTPTIFGVEDFVPRKGVMTRYAKKMVRPDMYGLVIVRGLLGEAGAVA